MVFRRLLAVAAVCSVAIAATPPAAAQNTNDINSGIQFDFSQPGARGHAIGGAFVAVADAATAVYGNPAGLVAFSRPELSGELRRWGWTSPVVTRGHAFGSPSRHGTDTVAGISMAEFSAHSVAPSFLSFVYPAGKFSVGAFTRALTRYRMRRQPEGAFFNCSGGSRGPGGQMPYCEPRAAADDIDRLNPAQQSIDLDITAAGAAFGYRLSDALSVGFGVQAARFEMDAINRVFSIDDADKFAPPDFRESNVGLISTQTGTDYSWALNGGILWKPLPAWAIGASYQGGPEFTFHTTSATVRDGVFVDIPENPFKVPDQGAVGIAFRPNLGAANGFWLLTAEYERVNYSQLL